MVTIHQIARKLGVSPSTVSAVLNNRGYISASMRARVEEALAEADYHPNQVARSLRLGKTHLIGLIAPDLTNSFFSHLLRGAEDYLATVGYRLIAADSREDWKRQQDYLLAFSGRTTDGIILAPCMATDEQFAKIPQLVRKVPFVYVDRSPLEGNTDSVLVDNTQAAFDATRHLCDLGHRRIAIITGPLNLLNVSERLKGYKQALRTVGLTVDKRLIYVGNNTQDSGYWRGMDLLKSKDRPTAVVACNNLMTLGLLGAIKERGISVPSELSIVGFDDFESSPYMHPPLTMVRQPVEELGMAAGKALLKRILYSDQSGVTRTLLPTQLIVRESTAAPPA